MPYTPPGAQSPSTSATTSPAPSRRSSVTEDVRSPSLPRSQSYSKKHQQGKKAAVENVLAKAATALSKTASAPVPAPAPAPTKKAVAESSRADSSDEEVLSLVGGRLQNSREVRRGHKRSQTEPKAATMMTMPRAQSASASAVTSEDESEGTPRSKPLMVRKKSGELVRPALRRRPTSMPGTPTSFKAVHFDSHLEHVRHFLQVDRPLAVSAGSSPVETHDSEDEYPFYARRASKPAPVVTSWDFVTPNFPAATPLRLAQPVRLERVWLSADHKFLMGSVAVANLAFQKLLLARFTLDGWKTTSEVTADFSCKLGPNTDRFSFAIKLADTTNLETKTMYLCIRYNVNGQDYWDNNNDSNFHIGFVKKQVVRQAAKKEDSKPRALPRSRKHNASPRSPSVSSPAADLSTKKSVAEFLDDNGPVLRMKQPPNKVAMAAPVPAANAPGLSDRYDFGASLDAAKKDSPKKLPVASDGRVDILSPALRSASYEELVNKYCFFGSKPVVPAPAPALQAPRTLPVHDASMRYQQAMFAPRQPAVRSQSFPAALPSLTSPPASDGSSPSSIASLSPTSPPSPTSLIDNMSAYMSSSSTGHYDFSLHDRFPFLSSPEAHPAMIRGL